MNKIAKFFRIDGCNDAVIPRRATVGSAGYDFFLPNDISLQPHEEITVQTGVRVRIDEGWFLMLCPRSSLGFKYGVKLANTVGIIDSDYFYSDNGGPICIKLINGPCPLQLKKGQAFAQGIFLPYGITVDDDCTDTRNGGFGSTDKR